MDKRTEINVALKEALKNKDKIALATIRLIVAALKDRDITERDQGQVDGVDDKSILVMLESMVKQRKESSEVYSQAGRDDLAEREELEIDVIRQFMPKQLSDDEVSEIIDGIVIDLDAQSIKDIGKIMGVLRKDYVGQIDMSKAGALAKDKLSK
ncbi:MAG: GatB/YqeY domain-containing protein [Alphaproteobacteria bacterium]